MDSQVKMKTRLAVASLDLGVKRSVLQTGFRWHHSGNVGSMFVTFGTEGGLPMSPTLVFDYQLLSRV